MAASPLAGSAARTRRIGDTEWTVLPPSIRDPRLRLAAVIVSLQVLGQVAFDFRLSIAQILLSVGTCALIEITIAAAAHRVVMWPASALLTGNGTAFVLRVPGTEHGDWWSLRGWWIFVATAAVAILSKHLIRVGGRHVFNPSNGALVLCFLVLGSERVDPLALWWGPMSWWMALALAIIVGGGLHLLRRVRLLEIALLFWLAFATGTGILVVTGHEMTARWHLGPVTGLELWRTLVLSPEVLVFLFFMITDPKTTPAGRAGRRVYAVSIGLLAVLLIAPQVTEFATKVAILAALALVCAARPLVELAGARLGNPFSRLLPRSRLARGAAGLAAATAFAGVLAVAGVPARPGPAIAGTAVSDPARLPPVTVGRSRGVASTIDAPLARRIARDLVTDLRTEAEVLRRRDERRAAEAATGARLQSLWQEIRAARGGPVAVPTIEVDRLHLSLEAQTGQGPPLVVATVHGRRQVVTYPAASGAARRGPVEPVTQTLELVASGPRYLIAGTRGLPAAPARPAGGQPSPLAGVQLADVAAAVGLDVRQGVFRHRVDPGDQPAMMGGGLCWLDYDDDGWLDLFVVNSFSDLERSDWEQHGGLPRSALFHNVRGRFVDVSRASGADLAVRGTGCVAGDLDGDGRTDLVVTGAESMELLWNEGGGSFREGAAAAGLTEYGWHTGAAIADVNGDGRPDLLVAGYVDRNAPVPGAAGGFPSTFRGVRDLLYLNGGPGAHTRARFREVGAQAGIDAREEHGLGALFTDANGDGRPDLYVANDADPNRLYLNLADARSPLGFRLDEVGARAGVDDPNAGMGIAAADVTGDGREDLLVTNSHRQLHAVYLSTGREPGPGFTDGGPAAAGAFDTRLAGWGASWVDLGNDGNADLVLANGAIPVLHPARDAEPVQAFANLGGAGRPVELESATATVGLDRAPAVIGRGLAAADFDNDGRVDVAVNSIGGKLVLLRASGGDGHWLTVALPRFAPGAVVTITLPDGTTSTRVARSGSSYLSSEDPRLHFGLGAATRVRTLRVRYPDGREARLDDVAADRIVTAPTPS